MKQYLDLLRHIQTEGKERGDRTGTGTKSVFGYQMRMDLSDGFPLLTTKKVYYRGIFHELLWFLSGNTNIKYLVDNEVHIWDEWPYQNYLKKQGLEEKFPMYSEEWLQEKDKFIEQIKNDQAFAGEWGDLGPVYGKQWTAWEVGDGTVVNQIAEVVDQIKNNPNSRRIMVSGWNVGDLQKLIKSDFSAPPPCHSLFQFYVSEGKLSCQLYQRSADAFLGVPFNIASYALLLTMMAQVCDLAVGEFIHTFGDLHIYQNHYDQVAEQLSRKPKALPQIKLNPKVKDIFGFKYDDIEVLNYEPHPAIKAPISV